METVNAVEWLVLEYVMAVVVAVVVAHWLGSVPALPDVGHVAVSDMSLHAWSTISCRCTVFRSSDTEDESAFGN